MCAGPSRRKYSNQTADTCIDTHSIWSDGPSGSAWWQPQDTRPVGCPHRRISQGHPQPAQGTRPHACSHSPGAVVAQSIRVKTSYRGGHSCCHPLPRQGPNSGRVQGLGMQLPLHVSRAANFWTLWAHPFPAASDHYHKEERKEPPLVVEQAQESGVQPGKRPRTVVLNLLRDPKWNTSGR